MPGRVEIGDRFRFHGDLLTQQAAAFLAHRRARGLTRIFVLTTRTEHWFLKRGFVKVSVDDLPEDRRRLYNWQRKSLVLMKQL